jgi:hypothetical protein
MPTSKKPTENKKKKEDFKFKFWFIEVAWDGLTIIGLVGLIILLLFVLALVKL